MKNMSSSQYNPFADLEKDPFSRDDVGKSDENPSSESIQPKNGDEQSNPT
jgi:hypothetical protein